MKLLTMLKLLPFVIICSLGIFLPVIAGPLASATRNMIVSSVRRASTASTDSTTRAALFVGGIMAVAALLGWSIAESYRSSRNTTQPVVLAAPATRNTNGDHGEGSDTDDDAENGTGEAHGICLSDNDVGYGFKWLNSSRY